MNGWPTFRSVTGKLADRVSRHDTMCVCVCVCVCVCGPCAVCRCLSEDNQTASIDNFLHKYEGLYRCMAHGHSGDVITNDVRLEAQGQTEFAVHTVHAASHVNVKNT